MTAQGTAPELGDQAILSVTQMRRSYGGLAAVNVEELAFRRGIVTALIGPNGAGKSTLFNLISGFEPADDGACVFDGKDISRKPAYAIAQSGLVRTFQLPRAMHGMSVLENVCLAARGSSGEQLRRALLRRSWRREEQSVLERAHVIIEDFGLKPVVTLNAGSLSGGQARLLELARAVMAEPKMILLDEPMAGVAPNLKATLLSHIGRLRDGGMSAVIVEHDMEVVAAISDWVVCMAGGKVVTQGTAEEVGSNPDVVEAYLGTASQTRVTARTQEPNAIDRVRPDPSRPDLPQDDADIAVTFEARDVVAGYGRGPDILRGCSLHLGRAEVVGIIGPNGAGKSTLLKALFGPASVRSGSFSLDGRPVTAMQPHRLVEAGLAYIPQVANVFSDLSVEENLQMGLFSQSTSGWRARAGEVMDLFPALHGLLRRKAGLLSGGERQMLAMARALMPAPHVILMDEPSAGLAPALQHTIFEHVARTASAGVSVLIVEQNARQCLEVCDRAYVLDQGQTLYTGSGQDLLHDPKVAELYLGSLARSVDEA